MYRKAAVAVVGAGPSGSHAAFHLASRGYSPLVLEEHSKPGYPEHCTGHIPQILLQRLNPKPPEKIIQNKFKGIIFNTPDNKRIEIQFKNLSTCLINRSAFDEWLATEAIKKGAKYFFSSKVEQVSLSETVKLKVRDRTSNELFHLETDTLLDGEGWPPRLLDALGIKTNVYNVNVVNAVQSWFKNVNEIDPNFIEVYFSDRYSPGFYAWIAPIREDYAKIGLATIKGNPILQLKKFIQKNSNASQKLERSTITHLIGHQIPLGYPIRFPFKNIIPIGDAAPYVKSTTGGGLALALTFSYLAAETIAVKSKHSSCTSIGDLYYQEMEPYLPILKLMKTIRDFLNSISDKELSRMCQAAGGLLPELIETAYPEGDFPLSNIFKANKKKKWITVLSLLLYSMWYSPFQTLKLMASSFSSIGKPLPSLEIYS